MIKIFITLAAAFCGGFICVKLKIPAGGLIGAMIGVGILQINRMDLAMPAQLRILGEMLVGGAIGLSFTREFIGQLKSLLLPSLLIMAAVVVFGVAVGLVIHKTMGLDLVTSIFAASPGGITNMTIISNSLGADSKVVAAMQLVRLLALVTFLPIIVKFFFKIGL